MSTATDCRGVNSLARERERKRNFHVFFLNHVHFYRTTVIYRAQRCNPEISHSLFSEHQTSDADRAVSARLEAQTGGCIERSNAAIFRL